MSLVNQALPGFYGGVSQQVPELRHDTQVTEMINCLPTVVGGVTKRPPTELLQTDPNFPTDAFIYTYSRGSGNEKYMVCVKNDFENIVDGKAPGYFRIYDIVKGVWVNASWSAHMYLAIPEGKATKECFAMSTVGDTTFVVNKTVSPEIAGTEGNEEEYYKFQIKPSYILEPTEYYREYPGCEGICGYTSKVKYDGTITVTITATIDGSNVVKTYTTPRLTMDTTSRSSFIVSTKSIVSGRDVSPYVLSTLKQFRYTDDEDETNNIYVENDTIYSQRNITSVDVNVTYSPTDLTSTLYDQFGNPIWGAVGNGFYGKLSGSSTTISHTTTNWEDDFFYWVKHTDGANSGDYTAMRHTYRIYKDGVEQASDVNADSTLAATALASSIGGVAAGSVVKKVVTDGSRWTGADSWGNQASESWQGKIKSLNDLPSELGFDDTVIEIEGDDKNSFDSFYVRYERGTYKECARPGILNHFNSATMPHKIGVRRLEDDTYVSFDGTLLGTDYVFMSTIDWNQREVGDYDSAPFPSFIGQPIKDVFFFRNRLGFICGENVILSEAGEYYNFFPTTITTVLDSDPIDVSVDSNKALDLLYAIPYNKDLLLFGDQQQFIMSSDAVLTPKDVTVSTSTAFTIKDVQPVAVGPNVFFAQEKEYFSVIREYFVQPDSTTNDAADITAHCPNYIPKGITKLTASSKNDMVFVLSNETPDTIYVYNFYWNGDEKAQSAWHKWTLNGEIFHIDVIDSDLFIAIKRGETNIQLERIPLDYVRDVNTITYLDNGNEAYESQIVMTKPGFSTSGKNTLDDIKGTFVLRSIKFGADHGSIFDVASYRYNKPREYFYNQGIGRYPLKEYIQSKQYNARPLGGVLPNNSLFPSDTLLPGSITYAMSSDHKYPILGNVNNIDVIISNNLPAGFRISTVDITGTFTKNTRSI